MFIFQWLLLGLAGALYFNFEKIKETSTITLFQGLFILGGIIGGDITAFVAFIHFLIWGNGTFKVTFYKWGIKFS